jgi:hypothetical protein
MSCNNQYRNPDSPDGHFTPETTSFPLIRLKVMRKQKAETKFSKMATGKRFPASTKPIRPIAPAPLMPSPLQYLIAQRNLNAARPHPLAEGAD